MSNINLVTNPSFETGLTGWTATNGTASQVGAPDVTRGAGLFSCKVVATGGSAMSLNATITGLTVGKNYTVSFFVKTLPTGADFSVNVSAGGVFSKSIPIKAASFFQRRVSGFTATATSVAVSIFSEASNTAGDIMWIDRVMLNEGNIYPYFDGSYPFCSWSGTANASTSSCSSFTSALVGLNPTTEEVLMVNGLTLNTLAWSIVSKTGRYSTAGFRGDDLSLPGVNGKTFVPNKPIDTGLYSVSMFVLGCAPDGTVPMSSGMRAQFDYNYSQLLSACLSNTAAVTLHSWQSDGSVRTTQATLVGGSGIDPSVMMGGRRAEVTLAFEILSGIWADYQTLTVTGTASAAWSNQSLSLPQLGGGTAPIDDSVITVTGPITNPTVANTVTGTSVSYVGTVPAGQSWVIDCGAWTSKVNTVSVLTNTTHAGHPRFLLIDPGTTSTSPSILLTGSSTTSATNLAVTASRKHMIG